MDMVRFEALVQDACGLAPKRCLTQCPTFPVGRQAPLKGPLRASSASGLYYLSVELFLFSQHRSSAMCGTPSSFSA